MTIKKQPLPPPPPKWAVLDCNDRTLQQELDASGQCDWAIYTDPRKFSSYWRIYAFSNESALHSFLQLTPQPFATDLYIKGEEVIAQLSPIVNVSAYKRYQGKWYLLLCDRIFGHNPDKLDWQSIANAGISWYISYLTELDKW